MVNKRRSLQKRKSAAEDWYGHTLKTSLSSSDEMLSQELWTDTYSPNSVKEVAVHRDKLREVLEACTVAKTQDKAILLLTGPPGSSKSTCFQSICRSISLSDQFMQWDEDEAPSEQTTDELQQFEDFLMRAARYSGVGLNFKHPLSTSPKKGMQVILIETLPLGLYDSVARFHQQLRSFLAKVMWPTLLVFVLTKSSSPTASPSLSTSEFDNATLNCLFPPKLKDELNIVHIEFNPIAPSILTKALTRIANLASAEHHLVTPHRSFLQRLAASSSGDLRLAINNLQFMLTQGSDRKASTKSKTNRLLETSSVQFTERDSGMVLFHGLGKILYAKRLTDDTVNSLLPAHLAHWKRAPLSFIPETILDQCGLSGDDMVAWLHENYPLFSSHSLAAFEWTSERLSFSDAYLVGGMNWRLGLTPAADRNSDRVTNTSQSAGEHYAAMHVARAVILSSQFRDSSSHNGFKPLKAPQCKQNEWRMRNLQMAIRAYTTAFQDQCSGARLQSAVMGGWMETVLDRLPMEYQVGLAAIYSEDLGFVQSVCTFDKSNQQPSGTKWNQTRSQQTNPHISWKKGYHNHKEEFSQDLPSEIYCPPDAAVEGDAFKIDEEFNSDSEPLPF